MTSATPNTPRNLTPILDREAPFPPRKPPGSGMALLLTVWLGAVVIVAVCWLLDRPPILRRWFETDLSSWCSDQWDRIGVVGVAVSALAAFYLMLALHELGHGAAGLAVGFRLRSYRVGPLLFNRPFRVSLYSGPGALVNGVAELIPVATDNLARRGVAMVLGGPAANFLSAIVVLLLPFPITVFSVLFVVFSLVNGVNDLFPFESRLGVSDGRRIWMLLRQPELGERWLALLHLGGELTDGVLPEALSGDYLAKAVAVRDDSADTVTAHAIAYSAAFHQHMDSDAAQRLETCLAFAGRAVPLVREALISDAAVFQARRRKRADLADQWLAAIPTTTPNPWLRSRAEAAIMEAKGDVAGAFRKLTELEPFINSIPSPAQREAQLQLLRRWKSDLGS